MTKEIKLIGIIGRYKVRHVYENNIDKIEIRNGTHIKRIRKWDNDYEDIIKYFEHFEKGIDKIFRFRK